MSPARSSSLTAFHLTGLHPPSNTFVPSVISFELRQTHISCRLSHLPCYRCPRLLINLFVQRCYSTLRLSGCDYFGAMWWCSLAPATVGTWCDVLHLEAKLWEQQHHCVAVVWLSWLRASMITQCSQEHADQRTWEMRGEKNETLPSLSSSSMQTSSYQECQRKMFVLLILTCWHMGWTA